MNAVWYLRKLVRITFLLCCFCFLIGCSSSSNNVDKKIYVETDKSYLSDYVIQDEKVIFWCNIQIVNLYQEQKYLRTGDDGVLRSDEISIMDLCGCELVVLSACQTGLGYNHISEGVYGLQRAFKLAGAKRILMSLWDVSDFHTSLLMESLYRHLIEGDDFEIALSKSKNELRKEYDSPIYWGGFILLN